MSNNLVSQLAEQRVQLFEAAELLLVRLARGEEITADEQLIFDALGWKHRLEGTTPPEIPRQIARMKRVLQLLPVAKSPADLEQAIKTCDATRQRVAAERAKIQQQLSELNDRLVAIDAEERAADEAVTSIESARDRLREQLPQHIQRRLDDARRVVREQHRREIVAIEQRLHLCTSVPAIEDRFPESSEGIIDSNIVHHAQSLPADHPAQPFAISRGAGVGYVVNREAWKQYCAELLQELPALEADLAKLQAKYHAAMDEAGKLQDWYWGKLELAPPEPTMAAAAADNAAAGDAAGKSRSPIASAGDEVPRRKRRLSLSTPTGELPPAGLPSVG